MLKPDSALLVVARQPTPGQAKTRLVPPLLAEQAAALYEGFLCDTLDLMRRVDVSARAIAFAPEDARAYFSALAPDFFCFPQQGDGLGPRLDHAATLYLRRGYRRVVILDSDTPNLPVDFVNDAFVRMDLGADVALGPCEDGGYYLIGMNRPVPRLLHDVPMSTSHVVRDTLALADQEGLKTALLPAWYDVDDLPSLNHLVEELRSAPPGDAPHTRRALAGIGLFESGR